MADLSKLMAFAIYDRPTHIRDEKYAIHRIDKKKGFNMVILKDTKVIASIEYISELINIKFNEIDNEDKNIVIKTLTSCLKGKLIHN